MNNEKRIRSIKIIVSVAIIGLFVWFLIIYPLIDFRGKESNLEAAGKKYFEINRNALPTGNRVKTVTLKELYDKNFIETLYNVYSNKLCSIDDSFVKVKMVDGNYKYYTYLKCGIMSSMVDHKGPEIVLNGKEEITLEKGATFKDPGIKSVTDDSDGKMDASKVTIKGKVDTSKIGTYKITYTMLDSLANKGEVTRTVNVIETLSSTVKREASENGYYQGYSPNNFMEFSNMLYRIMNVDDDGNVRIVANDNVANVDYDGLSEWMNDYYYNHLNNESRKLLVNTNYCVDQVGASEIAKKKSCNKYVTNEKVGMVSVIDLNQTTEDENSFLSQDTMIWLANKESNKKAWTTRSFYMNTDAKTMSFDSSQSMIAKPVLTIKKGVKVISGDGTVDKPYKIENRKTAKAGEKLNSRNTGEFIKVKGTVYRIIESTDQGLTKVISDSVIRSNVEPLQIQYQTDKNTVEYNPTKKGNIGYDIENNISKFLVTDYFVKHNIQVPIYKDRAQYKKETDTKKYNVKLSAPDVFDMFSGQTEGTQRSSYWFKNSSKTEFRVYSMNELGNVTNDLEAVNVTAGVRVVGYLNKNCTIVDGRGTLDSPYTITK